MSIKDLSTIAIHTGEVDDAHGSPHTPIYNTSTFLFKSTSDIMDVVEGRKSGSLYTRYGMNPSITSLEQKLAALENAEGALVFSSGMAAEAATFLALGRDGVLCLRDVYGGTLELISQQLPQLGIKTSFLLKSEIQQLENELKKGFGMVFFETPTNPAMDLFDIRAISELAHRYNALVVVDNTFATPVNQQPLQLGADIVIHSATKYLGGHSDITAGAVMGHKKFMDVIWPWRKNLGQMLSPESASLLSRSLKTLVVRVKKQNESAQTIASQLQGHPKIKRVLFPGIESSPDYELAKSQMSGFGGMMTLELAFDCAGTSAFVDRLKIFALAPSLGGVESLVNQPALLTHFGLGPEEKTRRGISDSMVRVSIGLESPEDLIADITQALD
ncbi:MAG: PLP-dependent transferase [Pedobacter sp.]|nr:MAG: PLP-dependent transferase [Pedobacter sp.]